MADAHFTNYVREFRTRAGWSQDELAERAGLSRAGVSAIEIGRLVPSAVAALSLSRAFGCRVEDLFRLGPPLPASTNWAWPPAAANRNCRYWVAEVHGRTWRYPTEPMPIGIASHDGVCVESHCRDGDSSDGDHSSATLVIASCDPAVSLLAREIERLSAYRVLVFSRSSAAAMELLKAGVVHAAGVHLPGLSQRGDSTGNQTAVRESLGAGHALLRVANWEEGIAVAPSAGLRSSAAALKANLTWVGRETGSGARQCLDRLRSGKRSPARIATSHRGVAEAIKLGWADAGVCVRLTGEEAGLDFFSVQSEAYDLCLRPDHQSDPKTRALLAAVQSPRYRRTLTELPGYDTTHTAHVSIIR